MVCKLNIIASVDFSEFANINDAKTKFVMKMKSMPIEFLATKYLNITNVDKDILNADAFLEKCKHRFKHIGNEQKRCADEAFTAIHECELCGTVIYKN